EDYQDYPVFKGLQRPLEFMGFQGRYIYWAAGTAGGAIIIFIIGYLVAGFITGLVLASSVITFGGVMIFIRQRKGLHTKAVNKGIYIFAHSMRRIS
ncbi:MAG: DUF4133 domain-containing protein, partial [Bacteroidales bacterium]|nr:DUF4133 domain-containing protein [Bacteroidales bacterium]